MPLGGGQQQQTGGTVVGGPSADAAYTAAYYQGNAAQQAANAYQSSVSDAISQIRQQYGAAIQGLTPYTQTGIQALDQLNQYLGLDPYKMMAPAAPTAPTVDDATINNYILKNTHSFYNDPSTNAGTPTYVYTGLGNNVANIAGDSYMRAGQDVNGSSTYGSGALRVPVSGMQAYGDANAFINNEQLTKYLKDQLTQKALADPNSTLSQNYKSAQDLYNQQSDTYNKAQTWAQQYGTPLSSQELSDRITNQPGYQAQLNSGIDAIQRAASAKGSLGSGRLLQALSDYGSNQLSTYYGNTLSRLAQIAGSGQTAATQQGNISMNQGNNIASLNQALGDQLGNSYLAQGNSLAQAALAAGQQYKVIGQQSTGNGNLSGLGSVLGGIGSMLGSGGLSGLFG